MGFIGRGAPDVDEFDLIDGRPVTSAQRLSGRGERIVVQRRMLHARAGRQIRRQSLRQGVESLPARTQESFVELFRLPEGYLADFVGTDGPDKSTRPNMIVACGLDYKMLDEELQLEVIRTVRQHLLTPRGCGHSRPKTRFTGVRRRACPPNATSRARTARYGRGCCPSTSRHASISTGMHSCRRPRRRWKTSTRHPELRYRLYLRAVRCRPALRFARSYLAGVERRSRTQYPPHDPRAHEGGGPGKQHRWESREGGEARGEKYCQKSCGKENRNGQYTKENCGKDGHRKRGRRKETRSEKECGEETDGKKAGRNKGRDKKDKDWEITGCDGRKILPRRDSGASGLATAACGREPGRSCERKGKNCKTRI